MHRLFLSVAHPKENCLSCLGEMDADALLKKLDMAHLTVMGKIGAASGKDICSPSVLYIAINLFELIPYN